MSSNSNHLRTDQAMVSGTRLMEGMIPRSSQYGSVESDSRNRPLRSSTSEHGGSTHTVARSPSWCGLGGVWMCKCLCLSRLGMLRLLLGVLFLAFFLEQIVASGAGFLTVYGSFVNFLTNMSRGALWKNGYDDDDVKATKTNDVYNDDDDVKASSAIEESSRIHNMIVANEIARKRAGAAANAESDRSEESSGDSDGRRPPLGASTNAYLPPSRKGGSGSSSASSASGSRVSSASPSRSDISSTGGSRDSSSQTRINSSPAKPKRLRDWEAKQEEARRRIGQRVVREDSDPTDDRNWDPDDDTKSALEGLQEIVDPKNIIRPSRRGQKAKNPALIGSDHDQQREQRRSLSDQFQREQAAKQKERLEKLAAESRVTSEEIRKQDADAGKTPLQKATNYVDRDNGTPRESSDQKAARMKEIMAANVEVPDVAPSRGSSSGSATKTRRHQGDIRA